MKFVYVTVIVVNNKIFIKAKYWRFKTYHDESRCGCKLHGKMSKLTGLLLNQGKTYSFLILPLNNSNNSAIIIDLVSEGYSITVGLQYYHMLHVLKYWLITPVEKDKLL